MSSADNEAVITVKFNSREMQEWLAQAWESGLNTGIGYKTMLDIDPYTPEPPNPFTDDNPFD